MTGPEFTDPLVGQAFAVVQDVEKVPGVWVRIRATILVPDERSAPQVVGIAAIDELGAVWGTTLVERQEYERRFLTAFSRWRGRNA